jgi:hypothetical protein
MKKTYTQEQVLAMIVDTAMTAKGDEWVPQTDEDFKAFLESYGLLTLFKKEYGGR